MSHPDALLDAIANDPLPARQSDREHITAAIYAAAAANDGYVHIAEVRAHITRNVWPPMIGSTMNAMRSQMRWTGAYAPNGGPSGNGSKPAKVWKLKSAAKSGTTTTA